MARPKVQYVCGNCGFCTNKKQNFERHTSRKTPCEAKNSPAPVVVPNVNPGVPNPHPGVPNPHPGVPNPHPGVPNPHSHKCDACKHVFSSGSALNRHIQQGRCKGVPRLTCPTCLARFSSYESKCNHVRRGSCSALQLRDAREPDESGGFGGGGTTNVTIGTQNNTVNINLYGRENVDHLVNDPAVMDSILKRAYNAIPCFVKAVHGDPRHPENQTVRCPNIRGPYLQISDGKGGWQYRNKREVLQEIVDVNRGYLEEHADSEMCGVHPDILEKFKECQAMLDQMVEDASSRAAKLRKKVLEDVALVLLNTRKHYTNT